MTLSRNEILTPIKAHNSVANLQIYTLYNPNIDLVNANVYTKFGYILSISSQDIERKRNSDINQGLYLCFKFVKINALQSQPRYYQC